jgi:YHS domain-containing protein
MPAPDGELATAAGNAPGRNIVNPHVRTPNDIPRPSAPQQPPAGALAPNPPLALDGYCAVTLAEGERWSKGDVMWGVRHRGRTYLFASEQQKQRFMADPDRYSPILSGYDPTRYIDSGEVVPGQRRHGMWFRGKIYLFADEDSLQRFSLRPEYYAQKAYEIMMTAGR